MNIIIQKFGGTSVVSKKAREQVIDKVKYAIAQGYTPVIVVSAMGRKGAPYATDSLLQLVTHTCEGVMAQNVDLLLSCGEIISAVVLADALYDAGLEAVVLNGQQAGIITDNQFNNAQIIGYEPSRMLSLIEQGKIAIVTGFQGATVDGEITTLGRGGSDTTASALAVALQAQLIEIYTDVDGVMTADPRIVQEAKVWKEISYEQLCLLATEGAKVVHPRAIELAASKKIPIRVCSTFHNHPGTMVAESLGDFPGKISGITSHGTEQAQWISIVGIKLLQWQDDVRRILEENSIRVDEFISDDKILRCKIEHQKLQQGIQILHEKFNLGSEHDGIW